MGNRNDCDDCGGWGRCHYDTRDGERSSPCETCGGSGYAPQPTTRADYAKARISHCISCGGSAGCIGGECFDCASDRKEEGADRRAVHDTTPAPAPAGCEAS